MFVPSMYKVKKDTPGSIFSKTIAAELPYEELLNDKNGNGFIIYSDGTMGMGMKMTPVYLDSLDASQRIGFHSAMMSFIDLMDTKVDRMQVVWKKIPMDEVLAVHADVVRSDDPIVSDMVNANLNFWGNRYENQEAFGIECTIWFRTQPPKGLGGSNKGLPGWIGLAPTAEVRRFMADVEENCKFLADKFSSFEGCFRHSKFVRIRRLTAQEIANTITHSLFREYRHNAPYGYGVPFRCQLGRRDFGRRYSYLTCGNDENKVLGALSCKEWPEGTFIIMVNALLSIKQPISISMSFRKLDPGLVRHQVGQHLKRLTKISGMLDDENVEAKKSAAESATLLETLQEDKISVYDTEMVVTCEAKTWKELDLRMSEARNAGFDMDMELYRENAALFDVFVNSLPGMCSVGKSSRNEWITARNVVDLLPLYGAPVSATAPLMLLGGPYGTCYGFNPRDRRLDAYHAFIVGGTGSGKSFFTTQMLMSYMALNPRVYIVDRGVGDSASYRKFCDMLGGEYISVLDGKTSFNPFEGLMQEYKDIGSQELAFSAVLSIMMEIVGEGDPKLRPSKLLIANRLIRQTMDYAKQVQTPPTLSMAYDLLDRKAFFDKDKDFDNTMSMTVEEMKRLMATWVHGVTPTLQSRMLDNMKTTVSLDNRLVVFDLRGAERNPALMRVLIHCINDIIMRGCLEYVGQPKILVFDEAWSFLESEEGSKFVRDLYKTARKLDLSVWSISQSADDFQNEILKNTIMSQSHQRFIFRMSSETAMTDTAKMLQLNSSQKELLRLEKKKGEYSEMLMMQLFSDQPSIVRCEVRCSPISYWWATTNPDDLGVLREYLDKNMTVDEAVRRAAEKYPLGVPERGTGSAQL